MVEQYMTRQEIRRLCRAAVGDSTDESISSQQTVQINAWIDHAAMDVNQKCRWLAIQRRATIGVDAGQEIIPYADIERAYLLGSMYPNQYLPRTFGTVADIFAPDLSQATYQYVGPGNITQLAICSSHEHNYHPLPKFRIPVTYDLDRYKQKAAERYLLDNANGKTVAQTNADVQAEVAIQNRVYGRPHYAHPRIDGIHLWPFGPRDSAGGVIPPTDITGKCWIIRIDYTISPTWDYHQQVCLPDDLIDAIPSSVDAIAIQYAVISDMYAQQGDTFQSERYRKDNVGAQNGTGKYWTRIKELRASESTQQAIPLDSSCTYDERFQRRLPNWARGPDDPNAPSYYPDMNP